MGTNSANAHHGLRWWLRRLFGRDHIVATLLDIVGIAGGLITFTDLGRAFTSWAGQNALSQFCVYLWVTFGTTLVLAMIALVLDRAIRKELRQAKLDLVTREKAIALQHQMAEEVRRCAFLRERFDCNVHLQRVALGLREMLQKRLGGERYAVTIKWADWDGKKLRTVFRDSAQDSKRQSWDEMGLDESVAYQRFARETSNPRKWVLIKDTERLPGSESRYRDRARQCEFRSVIAFPLRLPVTLQPKGGDPDALKCAKLIGFISIDAPEPDAFTGLFHEPTRGVHERDDAEDLAPRDDQDLFYGLADAAATILVLQRGPLYGAAELGGGHHDDRGGDPDHEGQRGRVRSGTSGAA